MKKISPAKRNHRNFDYFLKEFLSDQKNKEEWHKLDAEFAPIEAILKARVERGITQEKLAKKMETKQSSISRVESGRVSPTIAFLQKLAQAIDMELKIQFVKPRLAV